MSWQAKDASRVELQRMSRAIDDGQPVHAELPLSTQAGGRIWTQMSLTPVMSETEARRRREPRECQLLPGCRCANVLVTPMHVTRHMPDLMKGDLGTACFHLGFEHMGGTLPWWNNYQRI